uniref:IS3 family transposase n=1 Tax=Faecalibacterium prausnitzii TaxID=853 RepID=UPI003FF01349
KPDGHRGCLLQCLEKILVECIYRHKPETFEEANKMIDDYIYFYNHERIQLKTGMPPLSLRQSC